MEQTNTEPVGEAWKYDPDYHRMSDYLGVDKYEREDYELAKKMSFLRDSTKSKTSEEAMSKLTALRKQLGFNTQGRTLVDQLWQHVRLKVDQNRTQPSRALKPQPKQSPIQKTVTQAVQSTVQNAVNGMVQKALGDKKLIQSSVESALKGAIK